MQILSTKFRTPEVKIFKRKLKHKKSDEWHDELVKSSMCVGWISLPSSLSHSLVMWEELSAVFCLEKVANSISALNFLTQQDETFVGTNKNLFSCVF